MAAGRDLTHYESSSSGCWCVKTHPASLVEFVLEWWTADGVEAFLVNITGKFAFVSVRG